VFADIFTNRLMTWMFVPIFATVYMTCMPADQRTLDPPAGARFARVSEGRGVNWKNGPTEFSVP